MKPDSAGHQQVVVHAKDCAVRAVWLALVGSELGDAVFIALYIQVVAYRLDEGGDNCRLRGYVGMEAVGFRQSLSYRVL